MNKRTKLGNNIRCMRVAYGETQEQLGAIIGVEKSAISQYEYDRAPSKDLLSAIAKHYMLSIEELMSSDFSGIVKIDVNPNVFWQNIDIIFPIISTDEAMRNEHFCNAYAIHKSFFSDLKLVHLENIDAMDVCVEEYLIAYKEYGIKEVTAANLLGLWHLMIMILKRVPTMLNDKPAPLRQIMAKNAKIERIVEDADPSFKKVADDLLREFDTPEINNTLSEFMIVIKKSLVWSDLADYYLAFQYYLGIIDNGLSVEYNVRVGFEMLTMFVSVDNLYAARFLLLSRKNLSAET